jgi:hypothetical protein
VPCPILRNSMKLFLADKSVSEYSQTNWHVRPPASCRKVIYKASNIFGSTPLILCHCSFLRPPPLETQIHFPLVNFSFTTHKQVHIMDNKKTTAAEVHRHMEEAWVSATDTQYHFVYEVSLTT